MKRNEILFKKPNLVNINHRIKEKKKKIKEIYQSKCLY